MKQLRITPLNRPVEIHDWMNDPITPERQAASEARQERRSSQADRQDVDEIRAAHCEGIRQPQDPKTRQRTLGGPRKEAVMKVAPLASFQWRINGAAKFAPLQKSALGKRQWRKGCSNAFF
jgi:hypothetical protein